MFNYIFEPWKQIYISMRGFEIKQIMRIFVAVPSTKYKRKRRMYYKMPNESCKIKCSKGNNLKLNSKMKLIKDFYFFTFISFSIFLSV